MAEYRHQIIFLSSDKLVLRKSSIALILILLFAYLGYALKPRAVIYEQSKYGLSENIPKTFGKWKSDESISPVLLDPETDAVVKSIYSDTVSRTYIDDEGHRIMLAVAYGNRQTTRLKTHRQEVCYTAQGFNVTNITDSSISILGKRIPTTRMLASKSKRIEPVIYWFTMGDSAVQGHIQRLMVQLEYAMSGEITDGYLVRVSSNLDNDKNTYLIYDKFLNELFASMPATFTKRLIGIRENN